MDPTRHRLLGDLFERALAVPAERRAAFVEEACGDDRELVGELTSLLEAAAPAAAYFERLTEEVVGPGLAAAAESFGGSLDLPGALQDELGDRYRIERELGGGGMSRVFLAEETRLRRKVVIKVVPPDRAAHLRAEWFQREIALVARLQHAHIVPLLTADSTASFVYYTMPYVAGESLRERLRRTGTLPVREALRIWRDLLDGLTHAHAAGIVHRDIKPENILLSGRNALVTDFGIAQALEAAVEAGPPATPGLVMGTPAYMAPEQAAGGRPVDHRADLYAAGLVMYEMLAGRGPFASPSGSAAAPPTGEPAPLDRSVVPAELMTLVLSCLALEPERRPGSAEAVLAALETLPDQDGVVADRRLASRWAGGLGAGLLALAAVVYGVIQSRSPAGPNVAPPTGAAVSLAVLPLANLGDDSSDARLAAGLTEELIRALVRPGNVRVIASTSVFGFMGSGLDIRRIADSMGVSHVLEGSLQKGGGRLRIRLRLLRASDAATLWSESYDRELGDVFSVQDEIGRAVARNLPLPPGEAPDARGNVLRHRTTNIVAYERYLRGIDPLLTRSDSGIHRSLDYLGQAIAADSGYAAAWAAQSYRYTSLRYGASQALPRREQLVRAERAALRAVALDDSLAEAHASLAYARMALLDLGTAGRELQLAARLDPGSGPTHQLLVSYYAWTGRSSEALGLARRALDGDPLSALAHVDLARALILNRDYDAALAQLDLIADLQPPIRRVPLLAGFCYLNKAMWAEAIAQLRLRSPAPGTGFLAYALARAGQRDEARQVLDSLQRRADRAAGDAFDVAVAYAGLGDLDQAFRWLERAVDDLSLRGDWVRYALPEIGRDPRYRGILRRVGLQN